MWRNELRTKQKYAKVWHKAFNIEAVKAENFDWVKVRVTKLCNYLHRHHSK